MNYALFGEALASVSVAGRNPSWFEYTISSPAEQRAIRARWSSIKSEKGTSDPEGKRAFENYCRAVTAPDFVPEVKPYRAKIEGEFESAQATFLRGEQPRPDTSEDQGL